MVLWSCWFSLTEVQLFTEQQQQSQMSVSLNVQLLCTDSDVHGSECRLICDRGVLFCFVFLRKECFHLYCCCLDSRCVSCSLTDCVLACLFVCLWVVMHVAMQCPCLSTMCFCLWEWWIEGRQLMWFRCSTRSVCSAARACVRALSTCVQPNLQCTCVFVCLPPSSPLFHSSSCTPPTRYHFFLMLCSFWTRSK